MSIGKKIYMILHFGIYAIIDLACLGYIVDGLFFKLGFEDVFSSINENIYGAIGMTIIACCDMNNREIEEILKDKKRNICFSIILIVLAIGTYFFVHN
ncbi:hypothetical protein [Fusobacterium pseudoperiodonticum]|uniref:hypothetical protein n=1 Tax=Fusobacterium pseudoperiodonticum TaxID=2663009 RepID=UPI000C1B41B2|nr:hypothetical protein [Fusobacterium pseudoperiodonticum]ATV57246.1 hypothetical protein CTM68_05910 [Fusobacterium pseudoperiodonticum]ATV64882.1 hypothetical protein CTM78_11205 [Fusobacterium pseudoperiodonticum]PIM76884.1 hypothetical protein CTM69_08515 [Fusobacterium pseudoperiodonticum]